MESTQIDAGEFRAKQRTDWNDAAQGWHDWQAVMIDATRPVSTRLVELAEIEPGDRVLDVAAGAGEPSLTAAKAVGPEGSVVATDISARMLGFGRERAASEGLDNVEFIESDASSLDFPAESFDAALSRWGIIFEPEAEAAAGRVRGFLKPGSRMAIASWGPPDRTPMIALPIMTVMQRLSIPPPPPGTPGPLSRPTPDAVGGLLEGGGFSDVGVEELDVQFEWDSPGEFVRFMKEIAPPVTALLAPHPQEVQDETWAAIGDAVAPFVAADGKVRMTNLALLAAGRA